MNVTIEEKIEKAASALAFKWIWPDEAADTPDDLTVARAEILKHQLVQRMTRVARDGTDPTAMSIAELLPGVDPDAICVDPELV
jgi:hypothetical protein